MDELKNISEKLNISIDLLRDVSPEEIQYLLDQCPFLQIVDTVMHYVDEMPPEVQFIEARSSGWTILDYGDAMTSSPGQGILGFSEVKADHKGRGTIYNQAFVTAKEMVDIAQARGWRGIQLIDGHRIMKRAAWIEAEHLGLEVVGFEPTDEDKRIYELTGKSPLEFVTLIQQARS